MVGYTDFPASGGNGEAKGGIPQTTSTLHGHAPRTSDGCYSHFCPVPSFARRSLHARMPPLSFGHFPRERGKPRCDAISAVK